MQQEAVTPNSTQRAGPALLALRGENGQRITFAISRQYALVPLIFGCLALPAFLFRDKVADWVGAAGVVLCVVWALFRLAWVERLTLNFHSGRYRYRRGWWPIAELTFGVLGEIQSVTLDRQELSAFGVPVSLSDLMWRYAQIWMSSVWILGLSFRERDASLAITNCFGRRGGKIARASAAELARKLGVPLIDRTGSG